MKELQNSIKAVGYKALGKKIGDEESLEISCALSSYRHIFENLLMYEDILVKDLFSSSATAKVIFPCDLIELRDFLTEKRVSVMCENVCVFSVDFAGKYLTDSCVHMTLDKRRLNASYKEYGGLYLFDSHILDFDEALASLSISRSAGPKAINDFAKIVNEIVPNIPFHVTNHVPGVSPPMSGV